jgi:potassium/hydrogen antiporter
MDQAHSFGLVIGAVALVLGAAIFSNRISAALRLPAPAIFLVAAAVASDLFPALGKMSIVTVQQIVTVALVVILFDGGMHIGWAKFRANAAAITWIGVAGTALTTGALGLLAHLVFGLPWRDAFLIGTALAPTDPVVVFSVLSGREVEGRSGVLLEGESGANDPVGIALMASLLATGGSTGLDSFGHGFFDFDLQMVIGAVVGYVGGRALLWVIRRTTLPSPPLYSLRVLAGAGVLFGAATLAHGSGFLAVFVAGILVGDEPAPYKEDVERFHATLASLGEITAFVVLGLTVSLSTLGDGHAWQIGLGLAVLLAFVVRPLLVGLAIVPISLRRPERIFVLWAGLKGAVPILLATFVLQDQQMKGHAANGVRLYDIVIVVVTFSVVVQGGLVPTVARWVGLPLHETGESTGSAGPAGPAPVH